MAATLSTDAQILLAIGKDASSDQLSSTNTDIWRLFAESDMVVEAGQDIGFVANYSNITSANKQWLAMVHSHRVAWYAINQNQNSWSLATTQSKLNVIDTIWQEFRKKIRDKDIIDDLNL